MKLKRIGIVLVILLLINVLMVNVSQIYSFSAFNVKNVNSRASGITNGMDTANTAVNRIWGTVILVLQILAVAAVVIAGLKYMFTSADGKADIKKQVIFLIIGAILVFAASTVIGFIVKVTNEITIGNTMTVNSDGSVSRTSDYDNDGVNDWSDTTGSGIPDILNPKVMDEKYYEQWKLDHPDDPQNK